MTSMDMSLDEIIAKNRREKRSGMLLFRSRYIRNIGFIRIDVFKVALVTYSSYNPNKTVRINISNLAPSVVSSDLEELFVNYRIEAATVNYNESGVSVGTGDIYLRRSDAENVINDFKGVALDGQVSDLNLELDHKRNYAGSLHFVILLLRCVINSILNSMLFEKEDFLCLGERRDGRGSRGGGFGRRSRSGRRYPLSFCCEVARLYS
ncbi:unnamed protein product [Haemonchus placei]|uniref:RRM domain-containing protein n=1 Tax=Haemonchus placei TaxID=6290 RepID=A0A0N4WIL4_HAEPC|nr:unnamed protein product [Haemonchus placei]